MGRRRRYTVTWTPRHTYALFAVWQHKRSETMYGRGFIGALFGVTPNFASARLQDEENVDFMSGLSFATDGDADPTACYLRKLASKISDNYEDGTILPSAELAEFRAYLTYADGRDGVVADLEGLKAAAVPLPVPAVPESVPLVPESVPPQPEAYAQVPEPVPMVPDTPEPSVVIEVQAPEPSVVVEVQAPEPEPEINTIPPTPPLTPVHPPSRITKEQIRRIRGPPPTPPRGHARKPRARSYEIPPPKRLAFEPPPSTRHIRAPQPPPLTQAELSQLHYLAQLTAPPPVLAPLPPHLTVQWQQPYYGSIPMEHLAQAYGYPPPDYMHQFPPYNGYPFQG